jgi:small subunit ribosomal protein S16
VAAKIKLMRLGKIRAPYYRIVVADARTKRDGRAIETIGKYHPTEEPSLIEVDSERAQYWLGVGAQPTEPVAAILKVTGDWQKFKGLPGAEGTLRVAEEKADKRAAFETAAKDAADEPKEGATTPRKKAAAKKVAEAAEGTPAAARPTADEAAAAGDVRAAGSAAPAPVNAAAGGQSATDTAPDTAGSTSDDAAKADVATAQGAPAIEEITPLPDSKTGNPAASSAADDSAAPAAEETAAAAAEDKS